jgi:hypothetical protein
MAAKLSFVLFMDYAFFCVFSTMIFYRRYIAICFFCALIVSCDESKNFSFNPDAATLYHFTIETDETSGQDADNLPPPQSKELRFVIQLSQLVNGDRVFNLAYERIAVTSPQTIMNPRADGSADFIRGVMTTFSTDSARNYTAWSNDAMRTHWYQVVPGIIGDSVKVAVNASGRVEDTWAYEPIRDKITAATQKDSREVSQLIRDYVSPEALTDLVNGLFWYLPGRKIKVGEQWVSNIEYKQHAPVKHSHNITVQSIKDDTAFLHVHTIVSGRLGEGRLITTGEMEGTLSASVTSGMPYQMEMAESVVWHTDKYDVHRKKTRVYACISHPHGNICGNAVRKYLFLPIIPANHQQFYGKNNLPGCHNEHK